jgi:hypothetical protein
MSIVYKGLQYGILEKRADGYLVCRQSKKDGAMYPPQVYFVAQNAEFEFLNDEGHIVPSRPKNTAEQSR